MSYPLANSPLFRLQNKRRLCDLLGINKRDLAGLCSGQFYTIWNNYQNGKPREIQNPAGIRKKVHERILQLLTRIQLPDYLFSGKKGVSSIDNAKHHLNSDCFLCADIHKFYPNCKRNQIFRFFNASLKMSPDVAWTITDIVVFKDHLPTGSSLSQIMAFWINHRTFDDIFKFSFSKGITFSLYVDDMTFSSDKPIPQTMNLQINNLLNKIGLSLKEEKTRYLPKNKAKRVTGAIIDKTHHLAIPNAHAKEITDILKTGPLEHQHLSLIKRLLGKLRFVRQIKPGCFENVYRSAKKIEKEKEGWN